MGKGISCLILSAALLCGCSVFPLHKPASPPPSKEEPQIRPSPSTLQLQADTVLSDETIVRDDQRLYRLNDAVPWTGKVVGFYPNGRKEFELRYREGLREGLSNWWSNEGWIKHERTYSAGKLHGSWIEYYKSGKPRQEQYYQHGKEIYRRGWWPNGQLNFEIEFEANIEKYRKVWNEEGQTTQETGKPTHTSQSRPPLPRQASPRVARVPLDTPKPARKKDPPPNPIPPSLVPPNPANVAPKIVNPKIIAPPKQPPGAVSWNELKQRDGLYYLKNQKKPFTGNAILVAPNGGRQWTVTLRNGILGTKTIDSSQPVAPADKKKP